MDQNEHPRTPDFDLPSQPPQLNHVGRLGASERRFDYKSSAERLGAPAAYFDPEAPSIRKKENERWIERHLGSISYVNRAAAAEFLEMKRGQGVRSSSRNNIALALERLDGAMVGKPWIQVDDRDVARFMSGLRLQHYSDDNLRTTAQWLKHFLRWLRQDGSLPYRMQLAFRVTGNRNLPEPPVLTPQERERLLAAAPSMRDQVIIGLLLEAGFRVNELCNLNVGSVEFDDKGGAWIKLPEIGEGLKTGARAGYDSCNRSMKSMSDELRRAW